MANINREIQDLVMDYAGALRDGCVPDFLKSLTKKEAATLQSSRELPEAAEMIRLLNGFSFADQAVMPNVSLFISRVDARIGARMKQNKQARPAKSTSRSRTPQNVKYE